MKAMPPLLLLLTAIVMHTMVTAQCNMTVAASAANATCDGCSNGSAFTHVTGGTAPFTYTWTNNISAGTVVLPASKDNSIYEETVANSNGAGQYLVAGMTNVGFRNRALIAFDIANNIPPGAVITGASLRMVVTHTSGASGPQAHLLYKVSQNWGEGASVNNTQPGQGAPASANDATWTRNFFSSSDWAAVGGSFNAIATASSIVNNPDPYTWSSAGMITDIQSWLDNPTSNFGWLLKSDETGNREAKRYGARENVIPSNNPALTVNYGPAIVGAGSSVSNLSAGTYRLTVTDALGCTASTTVIVGVTNSPAPPDVHEITTYRGAFAPAPEPQWTDGWTNWDPQNTPYGAATVTVSSAIISNTTWTAGNVYLLQGIIYVNSGITLTIGPGTVIRGDNTVANSSLFVARGAKINAIGTACNPIVFTSNKAIGARAKGDWGGLVILGNAVNNLGTNVQIEGTAAGEPRNFHGGTNDDDNSGTLKYVRIEYGGFVFGPNNEINSLTFGSVGRGTTIDYVQASFGNDDAFEWFGGTVNCKHLVAYRTLDDDFDTDNGFSGTVQYALGIKDPTVADDPAVSTSEGFESDNDANGTSTLNPKTGARFYNVTQVGAFRCSGNTGSYIQPPAPGFRRGTRLRRLTQLKIFNSIFMNNWRGLVVDAGTLAAAGQAFQNNIVAGDFTTVWTAPYAGAALPAEDAATTTFLNSLAFNNTMINSNACDILLNPWSFTNPDFRPNAGGAGAVLTSGATTGADITAIIEIDNALFTANHSADFLVDILENGAGATNGTITITIPKPSGWNITVPGLVLTGSFQSGINTVSNVAGSTNNTNGNWNFRDDGANIIATSKPGVTIATADFAQIGFIATRKSTTANGTNQNLAVTISGAGDNTPANNSAVTVFSAN